MSESNMKTDIFTIPTVTMALKAKKLLAKKGISANVVHFNANENKNGCSYGIEFDIKDYFSVLSTLKEYEIPHHQFKKE